MSILIFSDTHLTKKFVPRKFNKLKALIEQSDQVIINGDFWEGLSMTFDDFFNSEWKQLFPILKSKKTIYLFGNHDSQSFSDKRIFEFCDKAVESYKLEVNGKKYFFTHGQQYLYPRINKLEVPMTLTKKIDILLGSLAQEILIKIKGPHVFPKKFNNITKEERLSIAPMDYLLVCGHSHTPQYIPELNFLDLGFFNYGWANYLTIDNNGEFKIHCEKY